MNSGILGNLYLIYGSEEFLKEQFEKDFIGKIVDVNSPFSIMNMDVFKENDFSPEDISNAASTITFSNDRRLVLVKDSGYFYKGKMDDSEKMLKFLKETPSSTVILFMEKQVDKRSKLFKYIEKEGKSFLIETPKESDLILWIKEIIKENNIIMDNDVILYFLRLVAHEMTGINSEIYKVLDYVSEKENKKIEKEDIDAVCNKALETKIFDLIGAIGNKNTAVALNIYNNMLVMKESPIMILTMINRSLKIILQCKYLSEVGKSREEIAREVGLPPFVVKESLIQSRNFTKNTLYAGLEECLRKDLEIKTGQISDKLGVEMLILKYSTLN